MRPCSRDAEQTRQPPQNATLGAGRGQHEVAGSWCDRGHDGEDQKREGLFYGHVNLREAILQVLFTTAPS